MVLFKKNVKSVKLQGDVYLIFVENLVSAFSFPPLENLQDRGLCTFRTAVFYSLHIICPFTTVRCHRSSNKQSVIKEPKQTKSQQYFDH